MDVVASQVCCRGLQQPPITALVVGDVGLHLVVQPPVCDQHAFDTCYLGINREEILKQTLKLANPTTKTDDIVFFFIYFLFSSTKQYQKYPLTDIAEASRGAEGAAAPREIS